MLSQLVNGIKLIGTVWALNFSLTKEDVELYPEDLEQKEFARENISTVKESSKMNIEEIDKSKIQDEPEQEEDKTEVFLTIELGNGKLLQVICFDELTDEDYSFQEAIGRVLKSSLVKMIKASLIDKIH